MFVNTGCAIPGAIIGQDLVQLNKQRSAEGVKKADILREAGYVSTRKDGSKRLHFTAFYQELLYVRGDIKKVRVTLVRDSFVESTAELYVYNDNPVREVKAHLGYTGVKCDKRNMKNVIHLHPRKEKNMIIIQYV